MSAYYVVRCGWPGWNSRCRSAIARRNAGVRALSGHDHRFGTRDTGGADAVFRLSGGVPLVWTAFGAGQLLEGMAVTPWLVGKRVG